MHEAGAHGMSGGEEASEEEQPDDLRGRSTGFLPNRIEANICLLISFTEILLALLRRIVIL